MKRRSFLRRLLGASGAAAVPTIALAATSTQQAVIQYSPIAGFQFHQGASVINSLAAGQALQLIRESQNTHDRNAVAVYSGAAKLGYLPRRENVAVAQMLDREQSLSAWVAQTRVDASNPWDAIRIGVGLRV